MHALLHIAGRNIAANYLQHRDANVAAQSAVLLLGNPIKRLYQQLYFDVGVAFAKRRGEMTRAKNDQFITQLPELNNWIHRSSLIHGNNVMWATQTRIRTIVKRNETPAATYEALVNDYAFSQTRGFRLADGAALNGSNGATHYALTQDHAPDSMLKSWFNMEDEHMRASHAQLDREKRIAYAEPFVIGESHMMFPGDTTLGAKPSEYINCRCICLYYTD